MNRVTFVLLLFLLTQCKGFNSLQGEDADLTSLGKWSVDGNKLTVVIEQSAENNPLYVADIASYWTKIYQVLPKKMVDKYIKELELITDGKDATLAGVQPVNESNKTWNFGLDPADLPSGDIAKNKDFMHTLIHEFGHVLTLNNTQIEPTEQAYQEDEERYLTMEGLAFKDSYINKFVKKFWYKKNRMEHWDEIQRIRNQNKKLDRIYEFYIANKNAFFTDYAAESPEEDIAESWTFFILNERSKKAITERDEKLLFFYQFEELVNLRSEILSVK